MLFAHSESIAWLKCCVGWRQQLPGQKACECAPVCHRRAGLCQGTSVLSCNPSLFPICMCFPKPMINSSTPLLSMSLLTYRRMWIWKVGWCLPSLPTGLGGFDMLLLGIVLMLPCSKKHDPLLPFTGVTAATVPSGSTL